jgi:hypothetical protein
LAAGDAARPPPTSNTATPTHALRIPDAADWIVIMGNSISGFFYRDRGKALRILHTRKHRVAQLRDNE